MTIRIRDLAFEAIIGILDFERTAPQRVVVDCTIEYEGPYVDYALVREMIIRWMQDGRFELIEDALATMLPQLGEYFPQIVSVTMEVTKPDILPDCRVSVARTMCFQPHVTKN